MRSGANAAWCVPPSKANMVTVPLGFLLSLSSLFFRWIWKSSPVPTVQEWLESPLSIFVFLTEIDLALGGSMRVQSPQQLWHVRQSEPGGAADPSAPPSSGSRRSRTQRERLPPNCTVTEWQAPEPSRRARLHSSRCLLDSLSTPAPSGLGWIQSWLRTPWPVARFRRPCAAPGQLGCVPSSPLSSRPGREKFRILVSSTPLANPTALLGEGTCLPGLEVSDHSPWPALSSSHPERVRLGYRLPGGLY